MITRLLSLSCAQYEGVSRMQTSLRRKHRDRVVRRGLGMMIESDFYATEAGRQHFKDSLTSIRYCVQVRAPPPPPAIAPPLRMSSC